MTKWTEHVKSYCKKHKCSYKEGLQKAKHTYTGGMLKTGSLAQMAFNQLPDQQVDLYNQEAERGIYPIGNMTERKEHIRQRDLPIQVLHRNFQDITGLSFAVPTTWNRYEAMIAHYSESGLTELQIARMPERQRIRLIRQYMAPVTTCVGSTCVASGKKKKYP